METSRVSIRVVGKTQKDVEDVMKDLINTIPVVEVKKSHPLFGKWVKAGIFQIKSKEVSNE